jgi:hypothetical protein
MFHEALTRKLHTMTTAVRLYFSQPSRASGHLIGGVDHLCGLEAILALQLLKRRADAPKVFMRMTPPAGRHNGLNRVAHFSRLI